MMASNLHHPSVRFTRLSDRFRSLWTFYQFLGGVFKHLDRGPLPFSYDFQSLYRRLQEVAPKVGIEGVTDVQKDLDEIDRELQRIHAELRDIDSQLPPSLLRRFFDRLRQQDEKILFVLAKFYVQSPEMDRDTLDKLDILFTRLASAPLEDGRALPKAPEDLEEIFRRLVAVGTVPELDDFERAALVQAVKEIRDEVEAIRDFEKLLTSGVLDRLRELKVRLGRTILDPVLLTQVVTTNIVARNKFEELYRDEEVQILEDTNRIFEIERYLERNPDFATEDLREKISTFRRFRSRFDTGRKEENLKREDVLELRRTMHEILAQFDSGLGRGSSATWEEREAVPAAVGSLGPMGTDSSGPEDAGRPPSAVASAGSDPPPKAAPGVVGAAFEPDERASTTASLDEIMPPDPLLSETLHKIMFALELVAWDHEPEQAAQAKELHNLHLEPWEVAAYRKLAEGELTEGTLAWELQRFYLTAAALRVKMEEETAEITRLNQGNSADRLMEVLERAAQSLERARDVDRRFQWFIDDHLYRSDTQGLEQLYRSRFRFLRAYAALWLDHEASGGVTPL